MVLSPEDAVDSARSCQHFGWQSEEIQVPHWSQELQGHCGTMRASNMHNVCSLKFRAEIKNYAEAECKYGLNGCPPMSKCPNREPFSRASESKLVTV